ncbi:CBN-ECH-5 protein, partial [Aphelenchoides avenae]
MRLPLSAFRKTNLICALPKNAQKLHAFRRTFASVTDDKATLIVERKEGKHAGVVVIRMNRPETKNALSRAMLDHFLRALYELKFDRTARTLIIKSDVPGAFCAGADLKERRTMPAEEVPKFVDGLRGLMNSLAALPLPVIAAVDGFALGGGLEMALACDIRIASANAKMGLTETRLAIIPGAGGTQRLARVVGVAKTKELIFTAKMLTGTEAARIGLVNQVVESDPFAKALEIAEDILKT